MEIWDEVHTPLGDNFIFNISVDLISGRYSCTSLCLWPLGAIWSHLASYATVSSLSIIQHENHLRLKSVFDFVPPGCPFFRSSLSLRVLHSQPRGPVFSSRTTRHITAGSMISHLLLQSTRWLPMKERGPA